MLPRAGSTNKSTPIDSLCEPFRVLLYNNNMDPEKPTPNAQDARRPNRPYIARTEPLPETEGPSSEHKPRFFKTKQRAYGNMFQVQLGMRVVKFSQFQQDFILNMANQLMVEVEFLNVFVQEPNILYISMNISESEGESASYLETENDVFYLLEECRRLFEEYIGAWLS